MDEAGDTCGFSTVVQVIGGKWKVDILCRLGTAPRRFGRLQQQLPGISRKVLVQQLRELERDGLVSRTAHQATTPKVVYALTEHGRSLSRAVGTLCSWGEAHQQKSRAAA